MTKKEISDKKFLMNVIYFEYKKKFKKSLTAKQILRIIKNGKVG